jgi:chemosensory pili system protein ChpA (sensor histidine kinase/response regulator)
MRVAASLIENLLRQAGEVSISTVQLQGIGESLNARLATLAKQQSLMWERLNAIQELVELRDISGARRPTVGQAGGQALAGGGADPVFDALEMDEYNELHSATNFLAESITDTREYTAGLREDVARLNSMLKQQDVLSR